MNASPAFLHPVDGDPDSGAYCRFHTQNGYSLFPSVFSSQEVSLLRAAIDRAFAETPDAPKHGMRFLHVPTQAPELASVIRHGRLRAALSTILGHDYHHCDEFSIHADHFATWHTDTSSPSNAGHDFFWDPVFNVVQVALYLQDNNPAEGGGLDVVPGSHNADDPFCRRRVWPLPHDPPARPLDVSLSAKIGRRLRALGVAARARGLPIGWVVPDPTLDTEARVSPILSRAGDLVMFNLRCGHRATPSGANPPAKRAIFFTCGANNRATRAYGAWLRQCQGESRRMPCATEEYVAGFASTTRPDPLAV